MSKKNRFASFPGEIFVYICDRDEDGTPFYDAVSSIDKIDNELAGESVAKYELVQEKKFVVKKELI